MATILVTGAAGFIGSHLIPSLIDHGYDVVALDIAPMDHLPCSHLQCDIRDAKAMAAAPLKLANIDACVHLAAIAAPNKCKEDPALAWTTNVQGTHNVLSLCSQLGIRRMVFFSSAHVYGISPRYMPTDEGHPLALQELYTTTKIVGEQLCELFYTNHGVSYTTFRLFNAYGKGQSQDYFLGMKLAQAKAGGPVTMRTKVADVTKDWIHVSDVVDATLSALQTEYVGPLNIGTGLETPLKLIAEAIAKGFNMPLVPENSDDPGPTRMCCDNRRARATLKWEPKIPFSDGLAELISSTVNNG